MADDQKIKLTLEMNGAADVAALKAKLAELNAEAQANGVAWTKTEISAEEFNARAADLAPTIVNLTKVVREAEKAIAAEAAAQEDASKAADKAERAAAKAAAAAERKAAAVEKAAAKEAAATDKAAAAAEKDAAKAAAAADKAAAAAEKKAAATEKAATREAAAVEKAAGIAERRQAATDRRAERELAATDRAAAAVERKAAREVAAAEQAAAAAEKKEARESAASAKAAAAAERKTLAAEKAAAREAAAAEQAASSAERRATREAAASARATAANSAHLAGLNMVIRNVGFGISDVFSNNGPLGQKIQGFGNNVGQIVTGIAASLGKLTPATLGAAAALEIAVTATGAALTAAGIKSVDDLLAYFSGAEKKAGSILEQLQEKIKELSDKPHLIPVETLELSNALKTVGDIKSALEAVARLKNSQTEAEADSGKAVGKALQEAKDDKGNVIGAQGVVGKIRPAIVQDLEAQADAASEKEQAPIRAALADLNQQFHDPANNFSALAEGAQNDLLNRIAEMEAKLKAAQDRHKEAVTRIGTGTENRPAEADVALGKMVDAAKEGAGAAQQVGRQQLADRARAAGLGNVAGEIEGASPEAVAFAKARKNAQEKTERLVEIIKDAEGTDAEVERALQRVANMTSDQIDQAIHDTQRQIKAKKEAEADVKKRIAAAEREFNEAKTAAKASGVFDDLKAEAKDRLVEGVDRDAVQEWLRIALKAQLEGVPEQIQGALSDELARETVGGMGQNEINRAKLMGETREARKAKARDAAREKKEREEKADAKEIEKGLGDDFLAQAESAQVGIAFNPGITERERGKQLENLKRKMIEAAKRKFILGGTDKDKAAAMAEKVPDFVHDDVQQQMNQVRAGLPGGMDLAPDQVAQQLQMELQANLARRRVEQEAKNRKRGAGAQPQGFPSVPVQAPDAGASGAAFGAKAVQAMTNTQQAAAQVAATVDVQARQIDALLQVAHRLVRETAEQNRRATLHSQSFLNIGGSNC